MTLVNRTVSWNFNASALKPGAIRRTIQGENTTPRIVSAAKMTKRIFTTQLAKCQNSSLDFLAAYSLKTGTKAAFTAPSATISRKRLGILKATTKAWEYMPVPNIRAITTSRMNPKIREKRVKAPITEADLAIALLVDIIQQIWYI